MFRIKHLIVLVIALYAISCEGRYGGLRLGRPYFGINGGYGATTWNGLVPAIQNQNDAINFFAPVSASEGGVTWGLAAGIELSPVFALELFYQRYPNAKITFDEMSAFVLDNDGQTGLTTRTEAITLSAKIMMFIPRTCVRIYSSVGAGGIHRSDLVADRWHLSPAFGAGINYNVTTHVMVELGGMYIAGNGEAELDPIQDYIPFLYQGFFRIAYIF